MVDNGNARRVPHHSALIVYSQAGGWSEHQVALVDINPAPNVTAPASPTGRSRSVTVQVGIPA